MPSRSPLFAGVGLIVALVMPVFEAAADVVWLKNGDRITGDVNRVWDEELYIETAYADEFVIELAAVARIESDEALEIELRDHTEVVGRLKLDEQGRMVLVRNGVSRPFSPAEIEELEEPEAYFDWDARSDFSFSANRGNAQTTDFLWQAAGGVKLGDHRHRLDLSIERKEQDELVTKDEQELLYSYDWFFADEWFLSAGIGYERDPIRELSYRYTPGGGVGYQFFEDAYRLLEVTLAGVGVQERIGGITNESSAARWELRYRRDVLGGDMEFFHEHRYWHYLTGRDNRVVDTSTGFRWDVWGDLYMNAQIDWDWESDPAAGNEREDITYAFGIGIELE